MKIQTRIYVSVSLLLFAVVFLSAICAADTLTDPKFRKKLTHTTSKD